MKGLDLCRQYWQQEGYPAFSSQFPQYIDKIAVGLLGSGSECYGYDDDISQDHDFQPGFLVLLPDETVIDEKTAFQMERAYRRLPSEFLGHKRQILDPVGGNRQGVKRLADFLMEKTGTTDGRLSVDKWLTLDQEFLVEAINGEIFHDPDDLITSIRENLSEMPEDVRRKRLAGQLLLMGQSGQYNYRRILEHSQPYAAQLSLFRFTNAAMKVIFLLNRRYMPYYKWSFRAMKDLPQLSFLDESLGYLITADNSSENAARKSDMIEAICLLVLQQLKQQGLTDDDSADLEKQAYIVNDTIADSQIRNLDIFYTV